MLQKRDTSQTFWRSVQASLLLLIFLLGQLDHSLQHWFEHSEIQAHHHHAEAEADPCHRAIYHDDAIRGCAHPAHLTTPEFNCLDCEFPFSGSVPEYILTFGVPDIQIPPLFTCPPSTPPSRWMAITFLRGPPFV